MNWPPDTRPAAIIALMPQIVTPSCSRNFLRAFRRRNSLPERSARRELSGVGELPQAVAVPVAAQKEDALMGRKALKPADQELSQLQGVDLMLHCNRGGDTFCKLCKQRVSAPLQRMALFQHIEGEVADDPSQIGEQIAGRWGGIESQAFR